MSIGLKRIGIGALLVTAVVLMATLRPGLPQDTAEADLAVNSMMTFPSAIPGTLPSVAPASGPGAFAWANVMCDPATGCPADAGGNTPVDFALERVYPPSGSVAATFAANGGTTLVCREGGTCDLNLMVPVAGVTGPGVAVQVNGGGQNEIVRVTATDRSGSFQTAIMIFVETILASSPTSHAAGFDDILISYRCGDVGASGITLGAVVEAQLTTALFDAPLAGAPGAGSDAGPMFSCGADTAVTADDRVTFQTDLGILTLDAMASPFIDAACDAGDSVDALDGTGGAFLVAPIGAYCDTDWADNGVVTYGLRGSGFAGVASVAAQQSGGVGPLRTINVTLAGLASMSLFIDAPALVGTSGADFNVIITDQDGRPIENETVECSVSPTGGALAIIPQTGTSDATGNVDFQMIPTGASVVGGEELTITCFLDSNPDVRATATVNLTLAPELESVDLVAGCNPVASTWPDGTAASAAADNIAPPENAEAIWKFNPGSGTWEGYSPDAPQASDLASVDMLDAVFICVSDASTWGRPVI